MAPSDLTFSNKGQNSYYNYDKNNIYYYFIYNVLLILFGLLCGLVVRVSGYRCRGLGSIPGATRFSEK
jgi:hypothetical protein